MNREDIIRMAREAGGATGWGREQPRKDPELNESDFVFSIDELGHFAAIAYAAGAAAENEACAKACEEVGVWPSLGPKHCAEAIRARKQA